MTRIVMTHIGIGLFAVSFVWSTYWLGGGEFVRGESLATTYFISILAGIAATVATATWPFGKD